MRPEEKNLAYLWDMYNETKQITEFTKNVDFPKFVSNKMIRYAVERSLLILGEAANHVSFQFQEEHSEIPWHQIIGQRNVLAHEYGDIKVDRNKPKSLKSLSLSSQQATRYYGNSPDGTDFVDIFAASCGEMPSC